MYSELKLVQKKWISKLRTKKIILNLKKNMALELRKVSAGERINLSK